MSEHSPQSTAHRYRRRTVTDAVSERTCRLSAIAALAGCLWLLTGVWGIALALALGGLWAVLPTVYTFAIGQLSYAVLIAPDGLAGTLGALALCLLFVPELRQPWPMRRAVHAGVAMLTVTIALTGLWLLAPTWLGRSTIVIVFAVGAYGLHRYGLFRLGLLGGESSRTGTGTETKAETGTETGSNTRTGTGTETDAATTTETETQRGEKEETI